MSNRILTRADVSINMKRRREKLKHGNNKNAAAANMCINLADKKRKKKPSTWKKFRQYIQGIRENPCNDRQTKIIEDLYGEKLPYGKYLSPKEAEDMGLAEVVILGGKTKRRKRRKRKTKRKKRFVRKKSFKRRKRRKSKRR